MEYFLGDCQISEVPGKFLCNTKRFEILGSSGQKCSFRIFLQQEDANTAIDKDDYTIFYGAILIHNVKVWLWQLYLLCIRLSEFLYKNFDLKFNHYEICTLIRSRMQAHAINTWVGSITHRNFQNSSILSQRVG